MMSVWAPNNRSCVSVIVPKSQAAAVRKQLMGSNTLGKIKKKKSNITRVRLV